MLNRNGTAYQAVPSGLYVCFLLVEIWVQLQFGKLGVVHSLSLIHIYTVQLLPTGMSYPIYRAESRERFEQLLREDNRNDFYTEFLPANLDKMCIRDSRNFTGRWPNRYRPSL